MMITGRILEEYDLYLKEQYRLFFITGNSVRILDISEYINNIKNKERKNKITKLLNEKNPF